MKIAVSINTTWNVLNFRSGLIRALIADGHEVIVITPVDSLQNRLEDRLTELGCRHVPVRIENHGTSPTRDSWLFLQYLKILRKERPDVYLGYTIKPNIYGSLACNLLGIAVINNISGLGTAFIRENLLTKIVRGLYKKSLKRSRRVFFQNGTDRDLFAEFGLVSPEKTSLLPGSGIDLQKFTPSKPAARKSAPTFLMIARLLWDKGGQEYADAAMLVKQAHPKARFQMLGFLDPKNPNGIPGETIDKWVSDGLIEYLGSSDDVRPHIAAADCVVLPSYREGTPRTLLEAAAMGKPVIATDVPGCREVVNHESNGYLCTVRDAASLADVCLRFLSLDAKEKTKMGRASRLFAEDKFDEKLVIDAYKEAIATIAD